MGAMRIAVFGAGGVGAYFGGRLAAAGEDVAFIARGEHLKAMQSRGLRVASVAGDMDLPQVEATDDPGQVGTVDVVLVGVKAWQVVEAAEAMGLLVGPDTFVVPLQNGVEAPDDLASVLGRDRVLGGLCGIVSFIEAPGCIRHTGVEPFVRFGELDNRPGTRAERLRQAFLRAGVKAEIPADIHAALWMKFLLIAPWSGIATVTRAPAGVWRGLPETRRMLEKALAEVAAVGEARGMSLPEDAVPKTLRVIDGLPPDSTSSMQRDVMAGRPSELDAQVGTVVRLGREAGVETPLHACWYHSLLPMELRARGKLEFPV